MLEIELGVAGDPGREISRQGDGLIQGVGMQRLGVPQGGSHGLDAGAGHVVVRILLGEAPAGGLGVGAQGQRLRILRIELLDDLGPEHAGGAHLGDFHEVVLALGPEEGEARGERIDIDAGRDAGADVLQPVGQGVGHLEIRRGPGFLHMVTGDGDGVELRHLLGGEGRRCPR